MDGWELLGDYSEEERRRPLEMRLAERDERSLLLHEGIVYELRESLTEDRSDRYCFTLRPMAGIDEAQATAARRMAAYLSRSDDLERFSHPDVEVARYVSVLRRAKAIETFLTGTNLGDGEETWYYSPRQEA